MSADGWKQLHPPAALYRGRGRFPLDAYSEFMPPPRLGWKPYGGEPPEPQVFDPDDPHGWYVPEYQEDLELRPGLEHIAERIVGRVWHLCHGDPAHGISHRFLQNNTCLPDELAQRVGTLEHDRCVVLLPLALSRTQDDKGRVRWTLFGNSDQGSGKAFWKSFAPGAGDGTDALPKFVARLLRTVYGEDADDLHRAGFRILPDEKPVLPLWKETLPRSARPHLLGEGDTLRGVKYLLTFRPFTHLPEAVRKAYLKGKLHLLPTPTSLTFWGVPRMHRLFAELPLGLQAPLLQVLTRHSEWHGIRIPQAGLLHEPKHHGETPPHPELVRNTYKRTHRWDRILRDENELALLDRPEDKLLHVLFSCIPDDLGLYDKPMARNVQLWTSAGELLLDGPAATPEEIKRAMHTVRAGGLFGYRFVFPAMRVGAHEVYWHRPLVAYRGAKDDKHALLDDAPLGYLTAYPTEPEEDGELDEEWAVRRTFHVSRKALEKPVELWPRLHRRPLPSATLPLFHQGGKGRVTGRNVRKLFDAVQLRDGRPLPRDLARRLLTLSHHETLDAWLESLRGGELYEQVNALLEPEATPLPRRAGATTPESLTFNRTATRSFELAYWKTMAALAEGRYLNKNNADCVLDPVTQRLLPYHVRQLDALGDYLLAYYRKRIAAARHDGALAGELPFRWSTDFDFSWMGGWLMNRERPAERNILMMIPGKDRGRAVIMADHYDTAYMADYYEKEYGGKGARLAACGADDNHSATAALMLAAPIFLDLSKRGRLGCDVWLVHLTGEEFPADCLGARHLTRALVERTLALRLPEGKKVDLSKVRVQGVYVSDMIAHNNDRERDVFQMAPGTGRTSLWLAEQAATATRTWNESVPAWNERPERHGKPRGRRSPYGNAVPEVAPHLALDGQVRPVTDPRSTLYNTDGQIFSDAGVPVVLFMENYDINRSGYHDTHDTMANIDLDYGAAVAAIVIESVARAANGEPDA
jgi:hypothetical protein